MPLQIGTRDNKSANFAYGPEYQPLRQLRGDAMLVVHSGTPEVKSLNGNVMVKSTGRRVP